MFTAKIISIAKFKGRITIIVEYSNGFETFQEELSASSGVDMAWLKTSVRERIKSLQAAYNFADTLSINQAIDTTDPTPPTQAETEQQQFLIDYQRWLSVKKAIDAGILTGQETQVQTLLNKVKSNFKAAYLSVM